MSMVRRAIPYAKSIDEANEELRGGWLRAIDEHRAKYSPGLQVEDILDIGCSVGVSTGFLADRFPSANVTVEHFSVTFNFSRLADEKNASQLSAFVARLAECITSQRHSCFLLLRTIFALEFYKKPFLFLGIVQLIKNMQNWERFIELAFWLFQFFDDTGAWFVSLLPCCGKLQGEAETPKKEWHDKVDSCKGWRYWIAFCLFRYCQPCLRGMLP